VSASLLALVLVLAGQESALESALEESVSQSQLELEEVA
jgi:hypothetical protein